MVEDRVDRRLAAIFAADIAGYSRLMGVDEEGTLRQLKAHRKELVDPKITEHRGSRRDRKRVEMLFAHLKRIFRLGRLRLRGPCGAQFEFTLAAIAQNLRRLARLAVRPPPVAEVCFA
jgi:IS5 family transposase